MTDSIDVAISFDTTGSMYPCLTQVRRAVTEMTRRLFADIPDLRIAIIAHGDYCDAGSTYVTKKLDFTSDPNRIVQFVNRVEQTGGGDAPECYELVLHEARTELAWKSGRAKALVVIGDDVPHGPTYPGNVKRIDWRNELGLLLEANINVYGVHAMPGIRKASKPFYQEIAQKTGGFYLTLDQFSSVTDLLMAICYHQQGAEQAQTFLNEVERDGRLTRALRTSFTNMGLRRYEEADVAPGLAPVPAGRFQVMRVDADTDIRAFVEAQGVVFRKGRGFYELTKAVDVQQHKEVILQDRATGDLFSGAEAREMLGLSPQTERGGITERLYATHLDRYRAFIQSTSANRKLLGGTFFLYEVEDHGHA